MNRSNGWKLHRRERSGIEMSDQVILLHGLWMRAFTLASLRRRLEQAGYAVDQLDYASVFRSPEVSIELLMRRAQSVSGRNLHFVGHSLGGLIAMQALQRQPGLMSGRVVCLGSPLRGSAMARSIASVPGGGFIVGKHIDILRTGLECWDGTQDVGSVAGRLPIGLGFAIGGLSSPHDGTVSVAETELPGLTDHCVTAATHTGLLFSAEAAEQTVAFLRHGRFTHRD